VNETSKDSRGLRRPTVIVGAALLAVLCVGIIVFYLAYGDTTSIFPIGLSAEQVASTIRSWGAWAMVGSVLLMVAHSFVPLPAEFIAIANGMVFGLIVGTMLTWVGAMFGAILAFALARWLGRQFVEAILPDRYTAAIDEWAIEQGAPVLLVSRFLPVVNLAYHWFCRLGLDGRVPDHSTFSKNRHCRFQQSDLLRRLSACIGNNIVSASSGGPSSRHSQPRCLRS
jgi:hypothetical protein